MLTMFNHSATRKSYSEYKTQHKHSPLSMYFKNLNKNKKVLKLKSNPPKSSTEREVEFIEQVLNKE